MDRERLPTVVFVVALVFGVLAKLWRAADLYLEAGAADGFWWLPIGVGTELFVAAVFALVVAGVARVNLTAGAVVTGVGLGAALFWLALNDVSFRISQVGITVARLRGADGARLKDFHLMSNGDLAPAVVYAAVAVVVGAGLAAGVSRRGARVSVRALVVVAVVGAAVWAADRNVFAQRNFGMGESPVLLFARSWLGAVVGRSEVRHLTRLPAPATQAERLALLAAQEPQPPTAPPTMKADHVDNGILFFSEGIARKQTSLETLSPDAHESGWTGADTTPYLLKVLRRGGLDLENYYSVYHKSIAAIYAITCSDFPPPNARNIMEVNPRIDCGALPELLSEHQIHVGLFHGGDFGFYDKLQLLGARGFEVQKDARAIAGKGIWENGWGVDDRAVVDAALAWIDSLPAGERFFAVIIPITAHYPYAIPDDVRPAFPGTGAKDRFSSAVHFLDDAFGRLDQGLATRGLTNETALLYLADHGETVAERPRASAGRRLAYEPSLHVPMVIAAPKLFDGWQKNQRVGSHVDLLPTILDLLGLPPDPRHHGQSLIADGFTPRRIFVGANNGTKYVGFIDGKQKFIVNRNEGSQELYDLTADPFEQHNLAAAQPAKAERLTEEALAFASGQLTHLLSAPKVSGDIDTQRGLLEHVEVSVVRPDGSRVGCPRDPDDAATAATAVAGLDVDRRLLPWRRRCPGFSSQPFRGQALHRAGRTRTCVLANVPEGGGALELRLSAHEWLPFLTRIRAAVSRPAGEGDDDGAARLTAFGDGKQGQDKVIGGDASVARVTFPSSSNEVLVRLSGDRPLQNPVCLTFNEKAWRADASKRVDVAAVATGADADPDDAADEAHGAVPPVDRD